MSLLADEQAFYYISLIHMQTHKADHNSVILLQSVSSPADRAEIYHLTHAVLC